eukprot:TRINITY_DN5513_c0_g1_i4.p1 TRINITY_DN5513_c0_g1~~TRINITY_DN5513_c0_g1_i4.p1  ORF type:complete len:463 (+),score=40.75 TRINITY_DN5513_c0_g1_i4:293-1681(+)
MINNPLHPGLFPCVCDMLLIPGIVQLAAGSSADDVDGAEVLEDVMQRRKRVEAALLGGDPIMKMSAKELKDYFNELLNQEQMLLQTKLMRGAEAGLLANKVAALENQLELSRVTSLSPSQIGGRLMQNPSWQIDSSADVDRLLGPAPSDIVAMATELLAALQQGGSLTIDSLAERERQARGNSNESKWAHEEEKLQYAMGFLLSTFQEIHAGHCCWTLHDTHAPQQGLEGHKGRMDYTFTTGERWWAQVLFLLKLKTKLRPQSITHKAAVGELVECARTALAHQPLERSHMFGIALSRDTIQVISIQKSVGSALLHTDMLPFALESDSPGWHLLVRVLSAGHGAHGFISKDPPVINLPPHRFMDFKLKDWRQLRPNAGSQTLHMEPATQIWRATHTIGDQLPQHVAVKTCLRAACENEVCCVWGVTLLWFLSSILVLTAVRCNLSQWPRPATPLSCTQMYGY